MFQRGERYELAQRLDCQMGFSSLQHRINLESQALLSESLKQFSHRPLTHQKAEPVGVKLKNTRSMSKVFTTRQRGKRLACRRCQRGSERKRPSKTAVTVPRRPMFTPGSQPAELPRGWSLREAGQWEEGLVLALRGVLEPWPQNLLFSHPSHEANCLVVLCTQGAA